MARKALALWELGRETKLKKYIIPIIFAFALILRLIDLGAAQLWYDESFTALLSRLPLGQMITATIGDTHPPLYYLITWLAAHTIGSSEADLRLPSVIFGMVSLWLTWQISRRLKLSEPVQLAALVFMAINPMELHFSQEARMYTLFQAEILWCVLSSLNRKWIWVGLAATAALYTQNYALFFVPVIGSMAFVNEMLHHPVNDIKPGQPLPPNYEKIMMEWDAEYCLGGPSKISRAVLAYLVPMVLYLPWFYIALRGQMATVASGYWIQPVTAGDVTYTIYSLFWGFAMVDTWQPVAILVTFGMLLYALSVKPNKTLVWLGLAPLALAVLASLLWKPLLLFRGLIPSVPFIFLLVINALVENKNHFKVIYAAVIVVPVILAGIYGYYRYNPTNKGDVLTTINQVRSQFAPGDVIYHVNDGSMVGWMTYAPELPQYEMPSCAQPDPGSLSAQTRMAIGVQQIDLNLLSAKRVWVIYSEGPTSTQCEHDKAAQFTISAPVILLRSDQYVKSGVWLVNNSRVSAR
jgi:hypothetical protein